MARRITNARLEAGIQDGHHAATPASPSPPTEEPRGQLAEDLVFSISRCLQRGWIYIAAGMAICLTLAVILVSRNVTSYQATARLLVLQQGGARNMSTGGDPLAMRGQLRRVAAGDPPPDHPQPDHRRSGTGLGRSDGAWYRAQEVNRLTVNRSRAHSARVIQVGYTANTRDEAMKVMQAVIKSYEEFLKKNFARSTNETINLFTKARDQLMGEVGDLEKEISRVPPEESFVQHRRKRPVDRGAAARALGTGVQPGDGSVVAPSVAARDGEEASEQWR